MTIGKVFKEGILDDTYGKLLESLDAVTMLSLYQIAQGEEEYELLYPQTLPEENMGERILQDMLSFQYFRQKKHSSTEQVLKHLNRKHIHYSIWRNRAWLLGKTPGAHVKRGFLYYPEKKDGKVVETKVWLYSYKLLFAKPKSYLECMFDDIKIAD